LGRREPRFVDRPTVLPSDIFQRFSNRNFWRDARSNERGNNSKNALAFYLPSDIADLR